MSKIYINNEIRYDIANYNELSIEQKNIIWLNEYGKPYSEILLRDRIMMEHTSRLVKAYIEAPNDESKGYLWNLYDRFTRIFCDQEKYFKTYYKDENDLLKHIIK